MSMQRATAADAVRYVAPFGNLPLLVRVCAVAVCTLAGAMTLAVIGVLLVRRHIPRQS